MIAIKSEFAKNVLTLLTGTTIAQAIPIAISPILTRIYSPHDFGLVALFMAIVSIFGTIANGRYELAIMLPKNEKEALNLFALGFLLTSILSLILFLIVLFFSDEISNLLRNKEIKFWLYFVPVTVFFVGLFNNLNYYNTRIKQYKTIATSKVIKSFTLAVVQIVIGLLKQGATGLISGQIIAQFFANIKLLKNVIKNYQYISFKSIKSVALKYSNFPKYSLTAILANLFSLHLVEMLISSFFSVTTLGFYSLVQRVLGVPLNLIGNSIGQVFFQEAAREKQLKNSALTIYKKTFIKLTILGFAFFGTIYFFVEDIFALVFGKEWLIAGEYAKVVIPLFFIRFIYVSLSAIYDIFDGLKIELIWQISYFVGVIAIILFCKDKSFFTYLKLFTLYGVSSYLISLYITYRLAKGNNND